MSYQLCKWKNIKRLIFGWWHHDWIAPLTRYPLAASCWRGRTGSSWRRCRRGWGRWSPRPARGCRRPPSPESARCWTASGCSGTGTPEKVNLDPVAKYYNCRFSWTNKMVNSSNGPAAKLLAWSADKILFYIWSNLDEFDPVCSGLVKFDQVWSGLIKLAWAPLVQPINILKVGIFLLVVTISQM